jgi:hypothetical protein
VIHAKCSGQTAAAVILDFYLIVSRFLALFTVKHEYNDSCVSTLGCRTNAFQNSFIGCLFFGYYDRGDGLRGQYGVGPR